LENYHALVLVLYQQALGREQACHAWNEPRTAQGAHAPVLSDLMGWLFIAGVVLYLIILVKLVS
jgi:hypothetical protein